MLGHVSEVRAEASREVDAPVQRVRELIADYTRRPELLPPDAFTGFRIEEGGTGPGTVITYTLHARRRDRSYRMRAEQAGPDLLERDRDSSLTTRWSCVELAPARTRVTITTSWQGAAGLGGFFERTFAPGALRRLYGQVLDRLAGALRG
jgi:hypothetical protein